MQKRWRVLFFTLLLCSWATLNAQEQRWRVGYDFFFDNQEYARSTFAPAQTMKGMWLSPMGGIAWKSEHSSNALYAGAYLLSIPGSKETIDKLQALLYYQYDSPKVLFRAGSFPRGEVLPNYPNLFFSDSIAYFRPLMQGLFFQVGRGRNFMNVWMDWTGHATADTRESFFVGASGKATTGLLFADFQSYMFHYAGTLPMNPAYGVSEQLQGLFSLGVERDRENGLKGMASVGLFIGFERDRNADESSLPVGFTARANAELHGIGTENTFYAGDARSRLFSRYGTDLYWGSRFLQGSPYLQSKWYIRLMESGYVAVKLNGNLHVSQGEAMFQQVLTVAVSVDNFSEPGSGRPIFPWMKLFQ